MKPLLFLGSVLLLVIGLSFSTWARESRVSGDQDRVSTDKDRVSTDLEWAGPSKDNGSEHASLLCLALHAVANGNLEPEELWDLLPDRFSSDDFILMIETCRPEPDREQKTEM